MTTAMLISVAATVGRGESDPSDDQSIATLVIGLLTLVLTIGSMWMISHRRKRHEDGD